MVYRKIDNNTVEVTDAIIATHPTARYAERRKMLIKQIAELQAELAIVDAQIADIKRAGCVVPSSEVVIGD